jgi:hypothetical protein
MVKVSGVPYEVELSPLNPLDYIKTKEQLDEYVSTYCAELDREAAMMRARMNRLEDELLVAQELIVKQNIELINMHNEQRLQKESKQ